MIIAVDFDGTCVTHDYPTINDSIDIGSIEVLQKLVECNHEIILWTMRSGIELEEAKMWFTKNHIPLYGINRNPTQDDWTNSPKAYANLYIDDAALGCPLITDYRISDRPYVNWKEINRLLWQKGLLIT